VKKYYMVFLRSVLWLLAAVNVVPNFLILVTLMMETIRSSETSILTRAAWHNIPEGSILLSHCLENINPYVNYVVPPPMKSYQQLRRLSLLVIRCT
jgi:hypothetical protein